MRPRQTKILDFRKLITIVPSLENKMINATDKTGIRVKYEGCLILSSKNIIEKNKKNKDTIRIKL